MKSVTRPGRLLLAVLLAGVITFDVVLLDSASLPVVLLAGLLCAVLVVGSFSPVAESRGFLVALFGTQAVGAAVLVSGGHAVLALILGAASFVTAQRLRASDL